MFTLRLARRGKDKEAKSPRFYSRGLTGLGCRYNGKPVSKEAEYVLALAYGLFFKPALVVTPELFDPFGSASF